MFFDVVFNVFLTFFEALIIPNINPGVNVFLRKTSPCVHPLRGLVEGVGKSLKSERNDSSNKCFRNSNIEITSSAKLRDGSPAFFGARLS